MTTTWTPVRETHLYLDGEGKPRVRPSGFKVRMIIEGLRDSSPEEYARNHVNISVAEVYAALTYYHDHRAEMDEEIKRLEEFAEELRKNTPECEATRRVREVMEGKERRQ